MEKPWTEKHKKEAVVRNFELMTERCRASGFSAAHSMLMSSAVAGDTEKRWRSYLKREDFDPARINREVRRVRALAEGRLVRETVWRSQIGKGCTYERAALEEARAAKRHNDAHGVETTIVRVTRIRRVPS